MVQSDPISSAASREAGACATNGIEAGFAPSAFRAKRGGKVLICPAGKTLVLIQQRVHCGVRRNVFEAGVRDCARCRRRQRCCGDRSGPWRVERLVESHAMRQYLARAQRGVTRALYQK
jgi:hypothetical protein